MTKVVIVDDSPLVLSGLCSLLESFPNVQLSGSFENGESLLNQLNEELPDLILLDINLPDIDGLTLCKAIHKDYPEIRIIALTNFSETSFVKTMMRNGASGYLLKNCSKEDLYKAIVTVQEGNNYIQKDVEERLLNENFGIKNQQSFMPILTRREKEVLKAIAEELTNAEVAEKLFISIKTVETHRSNLLQKFAVKNTAGLIKEALIKGFIE